MKRSLQQLDAISTLTHSIGDNIDLDWAITQDFGCGYGLMEKRAVAINAISRNADCAIWHGVMKNPAMLNLMDAQVGNSRYRRWVTTPMWRL
ncbi:MULTISPECIES: hypothetical protein [unclassified Erwinia]|uniref:hypothetical protein n=1 Tax=unclassified Erwinia TaxID=2622719 RepID=UPI000C17D93F|nr:MULTISPECIES: hypothetical protein [unclassified Erwinia]PIJ75380.1 hypothetical protein BK416_01690 [Erwinia sp. OLSSP12]PIJ84533.1 hypothetical protein BLD46_07330 [Erwinia sp. OLMTSP26]